MSTINKKLLITVNRGAVELGKYLLTDIPAKLRSGYLLATDFFWQEGMVDWKPLSEIITEAYAAEAELKTIKSEQENDDSPPTTPSQGNAFQAKLDGFKCVTCGGLFRKPKIFNSKDDCNTLIADSIKYTLDAVGIVVLVVTILVVLGGMVRDSNNPITSIVAGLLGLIILLFGIYYVIFFSLKSTATLIAAGVVRGTYPDAQSKCPYCNSSVISKAPK